VARGLLQLAVDRDQQLAQRAGVGEVARFDRQDNARTLVQREGAVVSAQRSLEQAALELSLFLRDERGEPVVPDEERLPRLPEPRGELAAVKPDEVLARRPDVLRVANQKQQAELELRLQQNQLLPSLEVGLAVSKDLGVAPRPELSGLGPTELELTAQFELPLLFRAPTGRLQAARGAVGKLEAQLRGARDRVAMELRDAQSAFTAARTRLGLARREIELALELEKGERTRLELGEGTLVFVNLREQATAEARLREVDARLDGLKATATFAAVAATP
jgi:outer membrane protein TolC